MTWASILFYGWATLAYLPSGFVEMYNPTSIYSIEPVAGSGFVELGGEATWGIFFAGGSMRVDVWNVAGALSFWPNALESTVDVGLKWSGLRLGYLHSCDHVVAPFLGQLQWWGNSIAPRFDSGFDMLYLTISGGKR